MVLPPNFHFSKALGQNFLIDPDVPRKIADAAQIDGKSVLEIGPGIGVLTRELASRAASVLCVEVDARLASALPSYLLGADNVTVAHADIMRFDIPASITDVCANLPYSITSPVIAKLLERTPPFTSLTLMVQLEVAKRIVATANTPDYGAFSVFCQYYSQPQLLFTVPPSAFKPQPKVTSAVVRFENAERRATHSEANIDNFDEAYFFRIVRAAFQQRRKTLQNALSAIGIAKTSTADALSALGKSADARGETLSLDEFMRLSARVARVQNSEFRVQS